MDFSKDKAILEEYLPWLEKFLVQFIPGSEKATAFDYVLRKASRVKTPRCQVHKVHIDQSPQDYIENGDAQFRIINVWKPIFRPVADHPLTFASFDIIRTM
ncbi:hypothetical protein F4777DRAFT_577089 [Nemania sp. FL0916]|nr:hypothetical protein F4777DRAFT_577089 [Nemania sp. FL0916]